MSVICSDLLSGPDFWWIIPRFAFILFYFLQNITAKQKVWRQSVFLHQLGKRSYNPTATMKLFPFFFQIRLRDLSSQSIAVYRLHVLMDVTVLPCDNAL